MLDHIGVIVGDTDRSKAFYAAALAPLGITVIVQYERWVGMGREGKPFFWFGDGTPSFWGKAVRPATPVHVAFVAKDRATVDAFHTAAILAGAQDFGGPGLRAHYHPDYYGAFVIDPDGNDIEAVCHTSA